MKKLIAIGVMCLISSIGHTALDDYQLRRLPASLAKQFEDVNGNLRIILPSYVNDNGIMGGIRLTWERPVDAEGNPQNGVTRLVNQSGYLYDLNTRTYIAQHIAGQIVTYVTDDHYISKRLHPTLQRWQTRRCPLNGLVPRVNANGTTVYDNPSCVVIDNDWLNQTPPEGQTLEAFWAATYISVNVLGVSGFGYGSTNKLGSSVVWDLDDNYPQYQTDEYNLYRANGQTIALDEAFMASVGVPVIPTDSNSFTVFGVAEDKDTAWVGVQSQPPEIHQIQLQDDGSAITTTLVLADAQGNYPQLHMVSKDGLIVTSAGTCTFASGCTDMMMFDQPLEISSVSPLLLNNGLWVAANMLSDATDTRILDLRGSTPESIDVVAEIMARLNDLPAESGSYEFPNSPTGRVQMSMSLSVSQSGDHIIVSGLSTNGYRVYYFRKQ